MMDGDAVQIEQMILLISINSLSLFPLVDTLSCYL